ncbi:MAG: hypothetical protein K8L99_12395 [Anaerolineae bacterium]|nr:hypothetical protein [Anaerolineae bacterium]
MTDLVDPVIFNKDPDEITTLEFFWSNRLGSNTISATDTEIGGDDSALTLVADSYSGKKTLAQVSGGTVGATYCVKSLATLSNGDVLAYTKKVKVKECE